MRTQVGNLKASPSSLQNWDVQKIIPHGKRRQQELRELVKCVRCLRKVCACVRLTRAALKSPALVERETRIQLVAPRLLDRQSLG
jgi:hypothetical protein